MKDEKYMSISVRPHQVRFSGYPNFLFFDFERKNKNFTQISHAFGP
jgi:hypothetical protein